MDVWQLSFFFEHSFGGQDLLKSDILKIAFSRPEFVEMFSMKELIEMGVY